MGDKEAWRARLRAARAAVAEAPREAAALAVAGHLTALPAWTAAETLLAYAASASELPTRPLLEAALAAGKRLCLPRVDGEGLILHRVTALGELRPGYRGILEPPPAAPVVAPAEVDLALVPGVGFDRHGVRLGQGGGHYDRLLARLPARCTVCGLAFACQVVARLPHAAHDRPVALVVTEEGAITAGCG